MDLNARASDDGHAEKRARCTQSKEEIDKQRRERYQEVRDEVNKQRRERYKQLYAQKKDSINARRRERYQEANKDNINEQRRQRYQEADKDNINEQRRQRYQEADKDNINEQRRQRYQEADKDKDNINEQRRQRYQEADKDNINEQRRQRYQEADKDKDNINEQRRQRYQEADKDNINEQRRAKYPEAYAQNKDTINEQRREQYPEAYTHNKDTINEHRRERYPEAYAQNKDDINEERRERYPEAKDNINEQRRARRAHALEMQRLRHECLFRSKADEDITHIKRHVLDNMEVECDHCHALRWSAERPTICCRGGQVKLPILLDPPEPLKTLLTEQTGQGRHFRQNIRKYNSAFTMAFLEANIHMRFTKGPMAGGPHQFRVSGNVYHRMGPLTPGENQPPRFAQVYILETEDQLKAWQGLPLSSELREDLLRQLGAMLNTHNAYVQVFQHAAELEVPNVTILLRCNANVDPRTYNVPRVSDIAAFIPDGTHVAAPHSIAVRMHGGGVKRITDLNSAYDPLHFVLLFPRGEQGWTTDIPLNVTYRRQRGACENLEQGNAPKAKSRQTVTARDFAAFYLMQRPESYTGNYLQRCQKLYEEYIVDQYCKVESQRLQYVSQNQSKLRTHLYSGVEDATKKGDRDASSVGKRVILPSSFGGSPRALHAAFQDGIAICSKRGKADLFITMTANPNWPEVEAALLPGQKPNDRPDLITRVFKLKLQSLLEDLLKDGCLGRTVGHMYVIKFQKRGLPHAHILVIFAAGYKLLTPDDYDSVICAEIPDEDEDPELYEIIAKCYMHGPCGSLDPNCACMKDGHCKNRYPKEFQDVTTNSENGYPLYRRRNNGRTITCRGHELDNRWLVPHVRALARKYACHINVEYCASLAAIKYLHEYIYKGFDRGDATLRDDQVNEVVEFVEGRYICTSEGVWRLLAFDLHEQFPAVLRLPVHLENQQHVRWHDQQHLTDIVGDGPPDTPLTAWLKSNAKPDHAFGKHLLYTDYAERFTYDAKTKEWKIRKRGLNTLIGRMYFVLPNAGEVYFLRLLLHHVAGATSFQDLRTVHGNLCATFQEACVRRGLLEDDTEWEQCLNEAKMYYKSGRLRLLFCTILEYNSPKDPYKLWLKYEEEFISDIRWNWQRTHPGTKNEPTHAEIVNEALLRVEGMLQKQGLSLRSFPSMPFPVPSATSDKPGGQDEGYDVAHLRRVVEDGVPTLTEQQRNIYDQVTASTHLDNNDAKCFFILSCGGCGKTYVNNLMLAYVRSQGRRAIAVASSGIASLLLDDGSTAHSAFGISPQKGGTSSIPVESKRAAELRECQLIVWDEAPMADNDLLRVLDELLKDIMGANDEALRLVPFGGKTVVMTGDWRQILPVVPRGSRAAVIAATLKKSYLWPYFKTLELTTNIRVRGTSQVDDDETREFARWLLSVGEDTIDNPLPIPEDMLIPSDDPWPLVNHVFPTMSKEEFMSGCILAARNQETNAINEAALQSLPEEEFLYVSADYFGADCQEDATTYPPELLNKLEPPGMARHELKLKVGAPIILLRNLNRTEGLMNGTRLLVTKCLDFNIQAEIVSGPRKGNVVLIPRINLTCGDSEMLSIRFIRRQFPIKLAFALTINRSQGQSFERLGLLLENPVFAHGQLYVGFSRVTSCRGVRVILGERAWGDVTKEANTPNIVWSEIFS